jgi:hypothetical protein
MTFLKFKYFSVSWQIALILPIVIDFMAFLKLTFSKIMGIKLGVYSFKFTLFMIVNFSTLVKYYSKTSF